MTTNLVTWRHLKSDGRQYRLGARLCRKHEVGTKRAASFVKVVPDSERTDKPCSFCTDGELQVMESTGFTGGR